MKLSQYAKQLGINYQTAYRWFKKGLIQGYQMDTGTIIVPDPNDKVTDVHVVIYCRVSSSENKSNLDSQAERMVEFCNKRGLVVNDIVKEIGSGVNDNRPKLIKLLSNPNITIIVVEHKDRLTRFGFNYIETILKNNNRLILVANHSDNEQYDIVEDFVSVIYSFCARLYGLRRAKNKANQIKELLDNDLS